ncbi:amidase [Corynebacterium crudilactis]|uniref:amidase n=1 Tax=Corynebacterium crudilactis TaxID=1652495 RepID=A0A172QT82_9CORY|nr:amidase family protein [Corynebacterium crudilactis]ANE03876.1 amidase [Corynebacterium crudilactis]
MISRTDIPWMQATEIVELTSTGQLAVSEIAEAMISRVESVNPTINAIVDFDPDQVRRDAEALDQKLARGENVGPLFGVPFTIKDLTAVKDRKLTFGMAPMKDNVADHDAVIVKRLLGAGGLFLGKTNTPESGYYGGTDNHLFGPTHNPWKIGYTAGGSSGGAAAAVAAGLGPIAEGSDGAGSVRIPSAMCGVVGLKPSTGRIPQTILPGRYFEWAYHGPITRSVTDNALMLDVVSGFDNADPMSLPDPSVSYVAEVSRGVSGFKIAWSENLGVGEVDPEVADIARNALNLLTQAGATIKEDQPDWGFPEDAMWQGIWVPGFASEYDLLDWDSESGNVDENLIAIMKEAENTTAVDYGRAQEFRGRMWDTFSSFMEDYDILASPTLGAAAFPLEQFAPSWLEGKPLRSQVLQWLFTYPYNMMTTPAITVPAGFTSDGRPVGLQLASRLHDDAAVLRAACAVEKLNPWAQYRPEIS